MEEASDGILISVKINKYWFGISLILVLLFIFLGVYLIASKSQVKPIQSNNVEKADNTLTYKDATFGFSFKYPKSWRYVVLQENLGCCGKILFFPQTTKIETYTQIIGKGDDASKNVIETIAPVKVEISHILSSDADLTRLVRDNCAQQTFCDVSLAKDSQVAGQAAKDVVLKTPLDGDAIFFIKNYSGTGPSGKYLFNLVMRSDKQTQSLFNVEEISNAYNAIITSFNFSY